MTHDLDPLVTPVAALYIDLCRGPYSTIKGVIPYGWPHDARLYDGPHPVIAHPPCGHWGRYHHRAHDDGHTGPIAVAQVRKWSGVLEHPKDSKLWKTCDMPLPGQPIDEYGGWTIHINQCDWGHVAQKRTWLYIVGATQVPPMPPAREVDRSLYYRKPSGKWSGPLERMAKAKRHLTPYPLAQWLVALARNCTHG